MGALGCMDVLQKGNMAQPPRSSRGRRKSSDFWLYYSFIITIIYIIIIIIIIITIITIIIITIITLLSIMY